MISQIMRRIEAADVESPISVFVIDGELKAVFGTSVLTKQWIEKGKHRHIGTFNRDMHSETILRKLRDAL
jgi:hypothetical protein